MKKIFKNSIIVLSCMTSMMSFSQSLKFGVKAGLNYTNTTGSEIKTDAITNYHAGLVAKLSLTKSFAIQPELMYSTQGATYKTATKDFENKLGYITIPVMLQVNISESLMLELGPQAGFLLSEKNKFDANDSKTFDFTANVGLGLKITESLFAQARYGYGLTDIKTDSKFRNSVFQLSAGILLW
jgi:Outer membrane protein beta-barrel domain